MTFALASILLRLSESLNPPEPHIPKPNPSPLTPYPQPLNQVPVAVPGVLIISPSPLRRDGSVQVMNLTTLETSPSTLNAYLDTFWAVFQGEKFKNNYFAEI